MGGLFAGAAAKPKHKPGIQKEIMLLQKELTELQQIVYPLAKIRKTQYELVIKSEANLGTFKVDSVT